MEDKSSSVIFVFNDKNELALQLRAHNDTSYALYWDFSAGGGVEPGEDHKLAATRELREELGIESDLTFMNELLFEGEYSQGKFGKEKLYIYKTEYTGPFNPDLNEVEKVEFFTKEKIDGMIKNGIKFHPEFVYVWNSGIVYSYA